MSVHRSLPTNRCSRPLAVVVGVAVAFPAACAPAAVATPSAVSTPSAVATPSAEPSERLLGQPSATPLAQPPAEPAGDGTTATIATPFGNIVIEVFTESSPVAAENFVNLARAGYYDGVIFHRIVPEFVIQGGDGEFGRLDELQSPLVGQGGPGYTIQDEPVVGDYVRGIVAMARTPAPNSQGSQFFIVLDDLRQRLSEEGGYAIFGRVTSGMEVVDEIAAVALAPGGELPAEPVPMTRVTVSTP